MYIFEDLEYLECVFDWFEVGYVYEDWFIGDCLVLCFEFCVINELSCVDEVGNDFDVIFDV